LNKEIIQKTINDLHYWDMRVTKLECNHFADEITLVYDDEDGDVTYSFTECYKVHFDHYLGYKKEKPSSELTFGQKPCFLQNVEIGLIKLEQELYSCKILMPPMEIEIWCKNINASRQTV